MQKEVSRRFVFILIILFLAFLVFKTIYQGPIGAKVIDNTPPTVTVTHNPPSPNSTQRVTFTATAKDESGISQINIFVDKGIARTCTSSPCTFTGGPYSAGSTHTYYATARDASPNQNLGTSSKQSFTVATPIRPLWVTAYYATWGVCELTPQLMDYSAVTHIIHHSIEPTTMPPNYWEFPDPDGGGPITGQQYFERGIGDGCDQPIQADLINLAHQNGVKVIL